MLKVGSSGLGEQILTHWIHATVFNHNMCSGFNKGGTIIHIYGNMVIEMLLKLSNAGYILMWEIKSTKCRSLFLQLVSTK